MQFVWVQMCVPSGVDKFLSRKKIYKTSSGIPFIWKPWNGVTKA
jgi:hypothetical protein